MGMTLYEFDEQFSELMDKAVNELSPKLFAKFLDDITLILADYEVVEDGTD